ncbi:MAG: glycosyltransferase family 4 protein [candidate division Zixibacteria bacterium]|nr:glycosyltransferase family 4 protein [candidate division Zixibacteria bacterium]
MRIGIDARSILKQRTGVGTYTFNLIQHLSRLDQKNRYVLFYSHHLDVKSAIPEIENPNFENKFFRFPNKLLNLLWGTVRLPKIDWLVGDVDLYHSPNYCLNVLARGRSLMTIHDLNFLAYRQFTIASGRWHYAFKIRSYAQKVDAIIADSESTKDEIIKYLKIPKEKIHVIYLGCSPAFQPILESEKKQKIKEKYNIKGDFILYVGTLEPRKNLKGLILAYAQSRAKDDFLLVLAGGKGWKYKHIFRLVKQLKLEDRVVFCGYVPDSDLPALYHSASVFVYPSFYEGFGLPPLEAMTCGIPVIVSHTTSLPEVVGDAGIYVDPFDIEQISFSIDTVLSDTKLCQTLREKGLKRAKLFSWEKTARETMKLYQQLGR